MGMPHRGRETTAMSVTDRNVSWERFAAEVAKIAEVPPAEVTPDTRIIEDLAFDSLSLAELVVILIGDYDMADLSQALGDRKWKDVAVGQLFEEYCAGLGRPRSDSFELSFGG